MIAYNEALDEKVDQVLDALGVEGFTKWTKAYGRGRTSGPHLGTHVWPKANNVVMAVMDDEQARRALDAVREMRDRLGREGIKAFILPCEEMT